MSWLGHYRFAALQGDGFVHVGGSILQLLGRIPNSKCMRPPAAGRSSLASLVFPILLFKKDHVNALDHDRVRGLDRFCRVNEIAPHDVPAGVIVM
jgi:hypothetical protein